MPALARHTETLSDDDQGEGSGFFGTQSYRIGGGAAVALGATNVGIAATDTDPVKALAVFPVINDRKRPAKKADAFVAAVVQEVREHDVALICDLPGEKIRISLPRDVVGEALAVFGTPVSLKLETRNGFRVPVVERRIVPRSVTEHKDLDAWIDSIYTPPVSRP